MPINPNAPFTRVYVDLPTQLAMQMDDPKVRGGKSKKQFVSDAIRDALLKSTPKVVKK